MIQRSIKIRYQKGIQVSEIPKLKMHQDLKNLLSPFFSNKNNPWCLLCFIEDMLGRAIKTLSQKVPAALLQRPMAVDTNGLLKALGAVVDAASIPTQEKESLMSFVEAQNHLHVGPKSEGIVSILEDMKMKARDDLNTMITTEKESLHSFLMLKQSLEMQIAADQKEMEQAKLVKAGAQQEKATAEADLEGTQKDWDPMSLSEKRELHVQILCVCVCVLCVQFCRYFHISFILHLYHTCFNVDT